MIFKSGVGIRDLEPQSSLPTSDNDKGLINLIETLGMPFTECRKKKADDMSVYSESSCVMFLPGFEKLKYFRVL